MKRSSAHRDFKKVATYTRNIMQKRETEHKQEETERADSFIAAIVIRKLLATNIRQ